MRSMIMGGLQSEGWICERSREAWMGMQGPTALVGAGATPPIRRDSVWPEHITGPSCEQQVSSHVLGRDQLKASVELATGLIANGCIKRMESWRPRNFPG